MPTNGPSVWDCPSRPGFPKWAGTQVVIGYQYYGGITNWINALGNQPSFSPVKTVNANSGWVLCADLVAQPDGLNWSLPAADSDTSASGWSYLPAHKAFGSNALHPVGGNELFIDGSVNWFKTGRLSTTPWRTYHSWADPSSGGGSRNLYIYQPNVGNLTSLSLLALDIAGVTSPGDSWN
jgi:hypothetical protein